MANVPNAQIARVDCGRQLLLYLFSSELPVCSYELKPCQISSGTWPSDWKGHHILDLDPPTSRACFKSSSEVINIPNKRSSLCRCATCKPSCMGSCMLFELTVNRSHYDARYIVKVLDVWDTHIKKLLGFFLCLWMDDLVTPATANDQHLVLCNVISQGWRVSMCEQHSRVWNGVLGKASPK